MTKICKNCGHKMGSHQNATRKPSGVGYCYIKGCSCKKFEEEKGCGKEFNANYTCGKKGYSCDVCDGKSYCWKCCEKRSLDPKGCGERFDNGSAKRSPCNQFNLCNKCKKFEEVEVCAKDFEWSDWNCEGCNIHKMTRIRESDGKRLCKKCFKNQSLRMFKKPQNHSPQTKPVKKASPTGREAPKDNNLGMDKTEDTFNLSEKMRKIGFTHELNVEDVKTFIKKLKEEMTKWGAHGHEIIIDSLAGEELK